MPDELYEMEFDDFLLLREGWQERLRYEQALARRQTFIIAASMGQKQAALEKAWPDPYNPGKPKKMVMYKGALITEHQMKQLIKLRKDKWRKQG